MQHEYDIAKAFAAIENQLIASMIRNLDHHRAEETKEGIQWTQWQVEQLKYLEKYKRDNQKRFSERFQSINRSIEEMIREAKHRGGMNQEIKILEAIRKGFIASPAAGDTMSGKFFMLNQRKLEALIKSVTQDMERAETAILRKADDDYRKAIYNAQVYANSGAGTYEQAVDMATKDMLSRGLNCIEYANGARHTLSDYADMAIRTASKRAYLQGEGEVRQKWGIHTVIVNKRSNPCPHCLPFVGKVFIDDVWSGGKASDGEYPLLSTAIAAGLYHPRCKDSHTTYFPGISTPPDAKYTRSEIQEIEDNERRETKEQYAQRQVEKFARLSKYSLDPENKQAYEARVEQWKHVHLKTVEEFAVEKQRQAFFSMPKDITAEWQPVAQEKAGTVVDLQEYSTGGVKYAVDERHVVLDYKPYERKIAEIIARKYGRQIQMVPRVVFPQGISTPDYLINGVRWDLKSVSSNGKNVLYNMIQKKKRQASCFIFDLTNCELNEIAIQSQVEEIFSSPRMEFIDSLLIYKDGVIVKAYKRNK